MARIKNQEAYDAARIRLLDIGEALIRRTSFAETGINDVLKEADIPKGSFYHYFESKDAFAIAVAEHYSNKQVEAARGILGDQRHPPLKRLKTFFESARKDMKQRGYGQGCLMCNLSTELADEKPEFQRELKQDWRDLAAAVTDCLRDTDLTPLGLAHLEATEAADWLLNAWSGALTRMKANGDDGPLRLFMKTVFKE
jgi:TetR/AcrR family transcriptional repressor of nem operon